MFLALLPFHFVSCRHNMSTFLCSIKPASSLPLPVIVPIFSLSTVPAASSLAFLLSFCSCFHYVQQLSNFHRCPAVRHLRRSLVTRAATNPIWYQYAFVCLAKFLRRTPFLPQPFPFIRAWDRHQEHCNVPPMAGLHNNRIAKLFI